MGVARRVGKLAAWPVRRLLDPRFADVNRHVAINRQVVHDEGQATRVAVGSLTENVDQVVGTYAATSTESLTFVGAELRGLERAVSGLEEQLGGRIDRLAAATEERGYVERLNRLARGGTIADLDGAVAELLNYGASHRGFAAQAELWLNPAITVEHREGEVRLGQVNERIVEIPFVLRALGRVPLGARILDFGSSENALALSLATLGYEVTALDLRHYPFAHPSLTAAASPLERWPDPEEPFDAVLCVSTVEHVGLGWYGEGRAASGADRQAMERLRGLLVAGGLCVLTVPYGSWSVDEVQRRYDRAHLDALVAGWEVLERLVAERRDDRTWVPVEESHGHAVAMLVLQAPASA